MEAPPTHPRIEIFERSDESKEKSMGYIAWILAGLIAGWLTGKIMKGEGYGFFVDILLGIAGAL